MNKKVMYSLIVLVIVIFSFSVYFFSDREKEEVNENKLINQKVDELLESMTLEEKIGQMLIINIDSDTFDEELKKYLDEVKPGGVILMKPNFTTYEQTRNLVRDLKNSSEIPFIVSVDQEGGRVQRLQYLTDVSPVFVPDMFSLGKMNDSDLAYEVGTVIAEELRTLGINMDFAPVLDIYSNKENKVIGSRSLGDNVNTVSKLALRVAEGLEDNGVIPVFKHFPGHGDTSTDSHVSLPIINKTYEEAEKLEFVPFKKAIESGAKVIMTGHISFPDITGDNTPATLSKVLVTDVLKKKLGFKGLVITDALNMKALTNNYSNEEIILKAVEAGNDILLMPVDVRLAVEVIKNNVSEDRINSSVRKILEFKYKYLKIDNELNSSYLGSEKHKNIIDKIKVNEES